MTYGTVAHLGTIEDELSRLAKKAGEEKNIIVGYRTEIGTQKGGEWEFHVPNFQRLNNHSQNAFICSLELTYWLARNECFEEPSKLALSFPLNDNEKKKVIDRVSAMIDKVKLQIQSNTK